MHKDREGRWIRPYMTCGDCGEKLPIELHRIHCVHYHNYPVYDYWLLLHEQCGTATMAFVYGKEEGIDTVWELFKYFDIEHTIDVFDGKPEPHILEYHDREYPELRFQNTDDSQLWLELLEEE